MPKDTVFISDEQVTELERILSGIAEVLASIKPDKQAQAHKPKAVRNQPSKRKRKTAPEHGA